MFSHKIGEGESVVSEIVRASIQRGIFDREIFDKYGILTSHGIQKRYFEIVKRRKNSEINGDILLVDAGIFSDNVRIKRKNVNNFSENADISAQSKVKESKVKESKVDVRRARENELRRLLIPSRDEVRAFAKERHSIADPDRFYDWYEAGDWRDGNGELVRNWKQKFMTWERLDNGRSKNDAPGNSQQSAEREFNIRYDNELA